MCPNLLTLGTQNQYLHSQVMIRALLTADGPYKIPNYHAVGRVCCTNISSNTAFRGFGAPQAMIITEQWMQKVAKYLKLPSEQVCRIHSEACQASVLSFYTMPFIM